MSKKKISYTFDIRKDGEKSTFEVEVDFFSNRCRKMYNNIFIIRSDIQSKWDRISDIITEIAQTTDKKKIKELKQEKKEVTNGILMYGKLDILEERFEILKQVLIDNGYKQDFIYDFDFWDNCIDPSQIIEFLDKCAFKDLDEKKKQ